MKKILCNITICALAVALAGCAKDAATGVTDGGEGMGSMTLTLRVDGQEIGTGTRAEAPDDCIVKIADSRGYLYIYEDIADIPEKLWLVSGDYTVSVEGGTRDGDEWVACGWNVPYYKGQAEFTVSDGENTPAAVDCTIQNTLITVAFDETVPAKLSGYSLTLYPVAGDDSKRLVFDAGNLGETGYIMLAEGQTSVDWEFGATHIKNGGAVTKSGTVSGLASGKRYDLTFRYTEHNGMLGLIEFTVDESTTDKGHNILIPSHPVSSISDIQEADVWASHIVLSASIMDDAAATVEFLYRAVGSTEWLAVAATKGEGRIYSAKITGLAPGTEYESVLRIDGTTNTDVSEFTTAAAPQLPNWKLEEWHQNNVYYPYLSDATPFWGSGNVRAMGIINVEMTTPVEGMTPGSTAAQLQSKVSVGTFGAGNLFTGSFRLSGTTGFVNFGREFTARPLGLKVSYKATTGTVTNSKAGAPLAVGDPDQFQIQIALADSGFPHEINTSDWSTFIDYQTHPGVIAYGEIHGSVAMTDWAETIIPLTYRSLDRMPTHIVVVASASRYGDYFTGSTSSVMWIDDFELIYDENIISGE